jgi:hypothetical protein
MTSREDISDVLDCLTVEDVVKWFENASLDEREDFIGAIRLRKVMPCFYLVSGFHPSDDANEVELQEIVDKMLKKLYYGTEYEYLLGKK